MTDVPDYKRIDYRGFVFVVHGQYGMLLLHCTRKPKKGPHFQVPGGHVDDFEFEIAKEKFNRGNEILIEAAKMGTARELYEETGIDVRGQLERLTPVILKDSVQSGNGKIDLENMLDGKIYFNLNVTDEDFLTDGEKAENEDKSNGVQSGIIGPMDANGKHLKLKISHEHSGFIFENNPLQSIEKIAKHSGGAGSAALRMAMNRGARKVPNRSRQQQNTPRKISHVKQSGNGRYPADLLKPHQISPPRGFFSFCRDCC